ncbi:MotA/TolQ/ExbB proton channel family protein [Mariniblastus sp.]|nr:MotA/TolQ/ExbB proton channel family protein [Mariniblastus sp.]
MNFESGSVARERSQNRMQGMTSMQGKTSLRSKISFWLIVALFVGAFTVAAPQFDAAAVAVAQEDGEADAPAAAPEGETTTKEAKEPVSALGWLIEALGIYLIVFLLISVALVSLMIMNFLAIRRSAVCPPELIDGFQAHLDEKQYQEAFELAKSDESFLGNVLSAGLSKVSTSYKHAVAAMQDVGAEENMKLDHRASYLALIGTLAPMIGLLGTVDGMIRSFYTIATAGTSPDANKLAEGISTALLTTLVGLLIAIPAIAAYNIFKNMIQKLVLDVGITSDNLMGRFEKVGSKTSSKASPKK